jgi:hypothetical protein
MNRFGEQIYEDILHFHVKKGGSAFAEEPRSVAVEILKEARKRTPDESLGDLEDALRLADEVHGSPIYDHDSASSQSTWGGKRVRT